MARSLLTIATRNSIVRLNHEDQFVDTESPSTYPLPQSPSLLPDRRAGDGARRLCERKSEESRHDPSDITRWSARNIDAMSVDQGHGADDESLWIFYWDPQSLLARTRLRSTAGSPRTAELDRSNAHNPCTAVFVPPPPEARLGPRLGPCRLLNDDSLPASRKRQLPILSSRPFILSWMAMDVQACAHSSHSRRRGIAPRVLPRSLSFLHLAQDYIGGLAATRYRGPAPLKPRGRNQLVVGRFCHCLQPSSRRRASFEQQARAIEAKWRSASQGRARSAAASFFDC